MQWDAASFYSSAITFLADVCCGFNLSVHIFKCHLSLLSESLKAKECPFLIQLRWGTVWWKSNLIQLLHCILFRLSLLSKSPSFCLPASASASLITPPLLPVYLHQCPRTLVCLISFISVGIHERVGYGSCHVLVFWLVTFVTRV